MAEIASPVGAVFTRQNIGIPLALIGSAAVLAFGTPAGLSPEGHKALALFVGIFILFLTEAIPLAITGLLVVPAGALLGLGSVGGLLAGFASSSIYMIVGAYILAIAMVKTKLAERITYGILANTGCSPLRITLGLTLSNIALAFLVPSSTARTAILFPVCLSIINLFESEKRSNFAINVLLNLAFTNATIGAGILTATVPNPVTVEFIVKAGGPLITYSDWFLYGFPPALLMTFATWWVLLRMYPPEPIDDARAGAVIAEGLRALGPTTHAEWRTLAVFVAVVFFWATQAWTRLDTTLVCLAGACLLFLPKIGVIDWSDANKGVSWQLVLICGGGFSLGDVLMKTGATKWLAMSIFNLLGLSSVSPIFLIIIIMVILAYMHFIFVGTTVMATALMPLVIGIAETAGVHPLVLLLPAGMIIGGYPLVMFYSTLPNIIVYGSGKLRASDFIIPGCVLCLLACLVYAACAASYWRMLGLF